jgi:hypothetical protein
MKRKLLGAVLIGLLALGTIGRGSVFAQTAGATRDHGPDHAVTRDHGPDHAATRDHGPDHSAR